MIDSGTLTGAGNAEIDVAHTGVDALSRELITEDTGDGSGTITLEVSPDGGTTWFERATITLGTPLEFNVRSGELFRVVTTGGTSPAFNYWVF